MKNKEIEELLNILKKCAREEKATLKLNEIACKTILSYIEQLENNRNKAIKYINEMSGYDVEDYIRQDLLLLLKGDSDE